MAKSAKKSDKKTPQQASTTFQAIIAASVKGNLKPKKQKPKPDNNKMGDHAANMG